MLSKKIETSSSNTNSKVSSNSNSNSIPNTHTNSTSQIDTIIGRRNIAGTGTQIAKASKSSTSSSTNRRGSSSSAASELASGELDAVGGTHLHHHDHHAGYASTRSSATPTATDTLTNVDGGDGDDTISTFFTENASANAYLTRVQQQPTQTAAATAKNSSSATQHCSSDLLTKFMFSSNRNSKSVRFIEKSICLTTAEAISSSRGGSNNMTSNSNDEGDSATLASDVNDLSGTSMKIGGANSRSHPSPASKHKRGSSNTSRSSSSSKNSSSNNKNSSSRVVTTTTTARSLSSNNTKTTENNYHNTSAKEGSPDSLERSNHNRRPSPLYTLNQHNNTNNNYTNSSSSLLRNFVKLFRLKNKTSTLSSSPSAEHRRILEYSGSQHQQHSITTSSDSSQLNCC